MKRSLAPPRREKPTGGIVLSNLSTKKLATKMGEDRRPSTQKMPDAPMEGETSEKMISQKF